MIMMMYTTTACQESAVPTVAPKSRRGPLGPHRAHTDRILVNLVNNFFLILVGFIKFLKKNTALLGKAAS